MLFSLFILTSGNLPRADHGM